MDLFAKGEKLILCCGGRMDGSRIAKPDVPQLIFAGDPCQLYAREGDVMQYKGDCDDHGNLLPPATGYKMTWMNPIIGVQWHGNTPSVVNVEGDSDVRMLEAAANIVKKPLAQPGERGGYTVPREAAQHAVESGILPPDAILPVEPPADEPAMVERKDGA